MYHIYCIYIVCTLDKISCPRGGCNVYFIIVPYHTRVRIALVYCASEIEAADSNEILSVRAREQKMLTRHYLFAYVVCLHYTLAYIAGAFFLL